MKEFREEPEPVSLERVQLLYRLLSLSVWRPLGCSFLSNLPDAAESDFKSELNVFMVRNRSVHFNCESEEARFERLERERE